MTALLLTVAMTVPTPGQLVDWQTAHDRYPRWIPAPPATVSDDPVERWRPLVEQHFEPAHVDAALNVIACESHGNPDAANPRSTARGLFQFLRGWWSGAWGYPPFDPYDPAANVTAAAWLSKGGTDWGHWVCRP